MPLILHCFGASSISGEALRQLVQLVPVELFGYSRNGVATNGWFHHVELSDPASFHPSGCVSSPSIWISFAPIWLFAPFFKELASCHPERLQGVRGLVVCSSSSVVTKRFAANSFDRKLVDSLVTAETQLFDTCRRLTLPCRILRPTLIYGHVGTYCDQNLSRILQYLRFMPFLLIPAQTGLRQPIHATQLATVSLHLSEQLFRLGHNSSLLDCISLGGDITLTYADMIIALQNAQPHGDPARRCRLMKIPNRLFFMLFIPLLLLSPKTFEALLRIAANLSGFTPSHKIVGGEFEPFPVLSVNSSSHHK